MRLAMVAGEASGDLLGGLLLAALRQRWPDLQAAGIGGPQHGRAGLRRLVAARASWRCAAMSRCCATTARSPASATRWPHACCSDPPAAFIGVDAPDFNLGLEARLKAAGMKTIHFVCPSIWAWRGGRVKKMAASCDHVLCLFPFEPELLQRHGVAASYVGHPLADAHPAACRRAPPAAPRSGLAEADTVVAVLPGSRRSEIQYIAPAFLQAAARLHRAAARRCASCCRWRRGCAALLEPLVAQHAAGVPLQLLDGQSHAALAACDVTLIASGTATLEAALFKRPMVIGYRMHPLSWQLMKRMALPALGGPAQHPVPRLRRARTAAGRLPTRGAGRSRAGLARRCRRRGALRAALHRTAPPAAARHRALRHRCHRASPRRLNSSAWTGRAAAHARPVTARRVRALPALVAGVDEAGRGPLAGPVVAAAVILDELQPMRAWPIRRR